MNNIYGSHFDETRHWVVCQSGVLKEVKAKHALGVAEILPVKDGSHNVDQNNTSVVQMTRNLNVKVCQK